MLDKPLVVPVSEVLWQNIDFPGGDAFVAVALRRRGLSRLLTSTGSVLTLLQVYGHVRR